MSTPKPVEYIGRRDGTSTWKIGPWYVHAANKVARDNKLSTRKSNEVFYVAETYSQTTPESAEHGDFSDTGYECLGQFYSLKELIKRINDGGFGEHNWNRTGANLYQSDSHTICYRTGTEQQNCLHIEASESNMLRLQHALEGA